MKDNTLKKSALKSLKGLWIAFPMIIGTTLLVSIISVLVPKSFYTSIFSKNQFFDAFIGSAIGSISSGNPITSYIFGGEMLSQGIGLIAVTSFLVSWVTVGIIQLPAESVILGKRFAFLRNITAIFFAILAGILIALIIG